MVAGSSVSCLSEPQQPVRSHSEVFDDHTDRLATARRAGTDRRARHGPRDRGAARGMSVLVLANAGIGAFLLKHRRVGRAGGPAATGVAAAVVAHPGAGRYRAGRSDVPGQRGHRVAARGEHPVAGVGGDLHDHTARHGHTAKWEAMAGNTGGLAVQLSFIVVLGLAVPGSCPAPSMPARWWRSAEQPLPAVQHARHHLVERASLPRLPRNPLIVDDAQQNPVTSGAGTCRAEALPIASAAETVTGGGHGRRL